MRKQQKACRDKPKKILGHQTLRFGLWMLVPFVAIIYFTQLDGAFQRSISQILDSARIEEEFLLVPSATFGEWRGHFIYRVVSGSISAAFATYLCGFIIRNKRGGFAGLLGGITIAVFQAVPILTPALTDPANIALGEGPLLSISTGAIIGSTALALLAPGIGLFFGKFGCRLAEDKSVGFSSVPRIHFCWLWVPTYHYGLLLISPIAAFLNELFFTFDRVSILHFFVLLIKMLPVVIFAAPLYFGLVLLSGKVQKNWLGWLQQLSGFVIIFAGIVVFNMIAYFVMSGS
jgi:hypothetical protein